MPESDGAGVAGGLREALDRAGYTTAGLSERLGPHAFLHLAAREIAPLVRATRGGDHLDVLVRLFVAGVPVGRGAAEAALAPAGIDALAGAGIVGLDGGDMVGLVGLRPLDGPAPWVVAHDLGRPAGGVRP
ncbi:MAG TPA: hypothetical protein VKB57_12365, partial [Acidimicrobiales bacterium]|nr:hypothetical protein [Acidimicrobiales bacterium]